MNNLKFKKPHYDGMFYTTKEVNLPITIWMKYRPTFKEFDFHIDIDPHYHKLGLAKRAIEAAAIQFCPQFGTLVIAKARIVNPNMFKVIDKIKESKLVKTKYNKRIDRWEITPNISSKKVKWKTEHAG